MAQMEQSNSRRTIFICLLLALGTLALYGRALTFDFVKYDDQLYVLNNPHVNHGFSLEGLRWAFAPSFGAWYPLTWLSYMFDVQLFGLRPGGGHATNIILHVLNSLLLFLILQKLTGACWRSAVVAGLFAWHPLHVESVAWIAERKDVLSALFWMFSMGAWLRYARNRGAGRPALKNYTVSLILFALGLMSKPMVMTLPCILLLLDWWPLERLKLDGTPVFIQVLRLGFEKIPFFILSVASGIISIFATRTDPAMAILAQAPFSHRLITACYACFRGVTKTFWPSDLGATYTFITDPPAGELAGVVFALAVISFLAVRGWKTRPYWLFGWIWYLVTLFPTLNLVAAGGQPMADRYTYIPSIGLYVLICWEIYDSAAAVRNPKTVLAAVWGGGLAACFVASCFQLQYWRNEESLISRVAMPEVNFLGHANYAAYLMRHQRLAEAEAKKAAEISPHYVAIQVLLGEILVRAGKFDEAAETLTYALEMQPGLAVAQLPLGKALLGKKLPDEAIAQFNAVLASDPNNAEAKKGLADARTLSASLSRPRQ